MEINVAEFINVKSKYNMEVNEIVIEYRRGNPILTSDQVAIECCDSFIEKIKEATNSNNSKANLLKLVDISMYLIIQMLGLTVFILGLYNGSGNLNSTENIDTTSKWFFISSVLVAISGTLSEISKRYDFNRRSVEIYQCVQKLHTYILDIEKLKLSPKCPEEKLNQLKSIELELQPLMLVIFNNQITNESPREIKVNIEN